MLLDELFVALGFKVDKKGIEEFEKKAFDVKKAILGIGEAIAGLEAVKFIGEAVERVAGVQKFAEVVDLSARSVAALNRVAVENEGSVEGMEATIQSLTKTAGQAALGIGRGAMIFKKLGLHAKDAQGHVKGFSELLGDVADKMAGKSRTEQLGMAARLGIDEHLLNMLSQGKQKVLELTAAADAANPLTNQDYEKAQKAEKGFVRFKLVMTELSNKVAVQLLPIIDRATTAITAWFSQASNSEAFSSLVRIVAELASGAGKVVGEVIHAVGAFAKWRPGATILKGLLGGMIALKVSKWLGGIGEAAGTAAKAMKLMTTETGGLRSILTGGLLGLLILLVEDLWRFEHGGLSITGMLVNKWKPALDVIKIGIGALSAAWVTAMVPIGVSSAIGFLPVYAVVAAFVALGYELYQLQEHWTEVMDYIAETLNPIIDKLNVIKETLGFKGDIGHITSGTEAFANESQKKFSDPNLKWQKVHPNEGPEGPPADPKLKVHSSGIHMVSPSQQFMRYGLVPHHIIHQAGGTTNTTIHGPTVNVQKMDITAPNPRAVGEQFVDKTRDVIRNAQTKTVL